MSEPYYYPRDDSLLIFGKRYFLAPLRKQGTDPNKKTWSVPYFLLLIFSGPWLWHFTTMREKTGKRCRDYISWTSIRDILMCWAVVSLSLSVSFFRTASMISRAELK